MIADLEKFSRFVDVKGVRTHYCDAGEGDPLVLLHGGMLGSSYSVNWRHNIIPLSKDFRVIGIDRLGFGFTDMPRGTDYSLTESAEYVIALLEQLKIPPACLIGNSHGTWVACYIALTRPTMVKKLILCNSKAITMAHAERPAEYKHFSPPTMESIKRSRLHPSIIPADKTGVYTQEMWDTVFEDTKRNFENEKHRLELFDSSEGAFKNHSIEGRHITELIHQIDVPTLIMWGKLDIIPGERILWLFNSIKGCQMHAFSDAAHNLFMTHSDQFNKLVKIFCKL